MGQGDLARLRTTAAAYQRRARRRVMRLAKRPLRPTGQRYLAGDRLNRRHLQRFLLIQRRQQPRQATVEQCFAGAGRPAEQQVMRPGSGNHQGTLRCSLALHLA